MITRYLGILSASIASVIMVILNLCGASSYWPGLAGIFSSSLIFSVSYRFFDQHLWKHPKLKPLQYIQPINTPNISGTWKGTLRSSYDDFAETRTYELNIHQTWTTISIHMQSTASSSSSTSAHLCMQNPTTATLTYTYQNEHREAESANSTLSAHKGCSTITFNLKDKTATGDYFTNRLIKAENGSSEKGTRGSFNLTLTS